MIKDKEIATEQKSVEGENINDKENKQLEDKLTETKVEELNKSSNKQKENNIKVDLDITSQFQKIIEEALERQPEVKLADIAKMIKTETGKKVKNGTIEKVAVQLNGIKIIKIGKDKGLMRG